MNTTLIDNSMEALVASAKANTVNAAICSVDGMPDATLKIRTYRTLSGTGFQVIGSIKFSNGYVACRIIDVGPNSHFSQDWPEDIEAEAAAYGVSQAQQALNYIAKIYPQNQQTALLFKWGGIVAAGKVAENPKLAAVEAWIASVSAAALTGGMFPKPPGTPFVELMAE